MIAHVGGQRVKFILQLVDSSIAVLFLLQIINLNFQIFDNLNQFTVGFSLLLAQIIKKFREENGRGPNTEELLAIKSLASVMKDYVDACGVEYMHDRIGTLPRSSITLLSIHCRDINDDIAYILGRHCHVQDLVLHACSNIDQEDDEIELENKVVHGIECDWNTRTLSTAGLLSLVNNISSSINQENEDEDILESWENLSLDETDEDFTGEMVTLLLLLSFLWGELEPNKRPSSSSTLSKVEESIVCLLELLFTVLLESSLVLKPEAVRLFKSTKSLGFNIGILWLDSDKLGRGFLALGSSVQASTPLGGCEAVEAVFTIEAAEAEAILNSPPLTPLDDNRSRLRDSPVALLLALLLCMLSVPPAEIFGPMSTNLTLQVVLGPVLGVEAVTLTDDRGLFSPMPSRLLSVKTRFTLIMPTKTKLRMFSFLQV